RCFGEPQQGKGTKVINRSVEVATNSLTAMIIRSKADQDHLLEVRRIIEIQTVRLAAMRANEQDLSDMKKALERMNNADTPDEEYNFSDLKFHVLIARASKNPILESFMNAIQPLILEAIKLTQNHQQRPETTSNFHANIYESIVLRDADLAEKCMREHLVATEKMIQSLKLIISE
ncbi:FCD domain-containing protein, partial [Bacillus sp. JJ1521]|uniref:FadR/GntR family transcriptional regulator n=1 Tax=Bacillus sp. JJ1521 TaxID=3122957 RepID=UPI00300024FB